jgi:FKBP-type peptidyl-prolyl cis-trans isomerase (trigger factor)
MTPESKKATFVANLAKDYMTYNESSFGRKISETKAQAQANEMAEHPERFGSLMQKILESKGIKVNKDEAIRKLKDLDLC